MERPVLRLILLGALAALLAEPALGKTLAAPPSLRVAPSERPRGDLPRNAWFFFAEGRGTAYLDRKAASPLHFSSYHLTTTTPRRTYCIIRPDHLLPAGQTLLIRWSHPSRRKDYTVRIGDHVDHDAPAPPEPRVVEAISEKVTEYFEGGRHNTWERHFAEVQIESEGLITLVASEPVDLFSDEGKATELLMLFPGTTRRIRVGDGQGLPWPDARGGARRSLFFGSLDQAGNFSGWTRPVEVELPPTLELRRGWWEHGARPFKIELARHLAVCFPPIQLALAIHLEQTYEEPL